MNDDSSTFHDFVLKLIFYFVVRDKYRDDFDQIIRDVNAMILVCKKWNNNLRSMINTANATNYDRVYEKVFSRCVYNYHFPSYPLHFENMIRFAARSNVKESCDNPFPVDHCSHCNKKRLVIRDYWCAERVGCSRWICKQRVDPDDFVCNYVCCSPSKSHLNDSEKQNFEKRVRERSFAIWKRTGREDSAANYFEAEKQILYPSQIYP